MKYKLLEDVFLKKELEKVYVYSLRNEDLVVVASGGVCRAIDLLKEGTTLDQALATLGDGSEVDFLGLYEKLTKAGFTADSENSESTVPAGAFDFLHGSVLFTTFDQILPSKNVEVYASYCACSSCSYCDNCSCSDC